MSTIEDRLHAAARGVAATMTADSVPPLDLCRVPSRPDRKTPRRRRAFAVLAPIAAAVAVVAVIVTSVVFSSGPHNSSPADASLRSVPRYYLALLPTGPHRNIDGFRVQFDDAVIRDTLTGATLATIQVPKPFKTFDAVAGAADDRTFVLSASIAPWPTQNPTKFFIVRFNPSTRTVALSAAPIPELPKAHPPYGMALSPSGADLAISIQTGKPSYQKVHGKAQVIGYTVARVSIYTLATGAVRFWQSYGAIGYRPYDSMSISWSRHGMLAFNWMPNSGSQYLRVKDDGVYLLNTGSKGGNLLADSRKAVRTPYYIYTRVPYRGFYFSSDDAILTPDGTKIVVAAIRQANFKVPSGTWELAFEEFSAATGRLIRTLHAVEGANVNSLEWTNSSGSVLVVVAPPKTGGKTVLGVLSGRRFVAIPGAPQQALTLAF